MPVELQAPPPSPTAGAGAKLITPRQQALRLIKTQLERGLEIKRSKIRYVADLERAREAKGEWTTASMMLLQSLFSTRAVADESQNWHGKVLPEYADLNLFIEHFYDEMDQRLRKLHDVWKLVHEMPDPSDTPTQTTTSIPDLTPADDPAPAPALPVESKFGAVVIYHPDPRAQTALRDFCAKLGVQVAEIVADTPIAQQLDQHPNLDFLLILSQSESPPEPFDLGYFVGRLGLKRVFVLNPSDEKLAIDQHGLLHIPLDPADGWHLHLARHLKRAGLEIDLNLVF